MHINLENNFLSYIEKNDYPVVLYGAGENARRIHDKLSRVDYVCDIKARSMNSFDGIDVIEPAELIKLGKIVILITIHNHEIFQEVCNLLQTMRVDAEVFYLFDNPSFSIFVENDSKYVVNEKDKLKINIINVDEGWILEKFANRMCDELNKMGHKVTISRDIDYSADVNHNISYLGLNEFVSKDSDCKKTVITEMVTHVDSFEKRDLLDFHSNCGVMEICMSKDTMDKLATWGINRKSLCYINPAQDGEIKPKKYIIGITNIGYRENDYRKNEWMIFDIFRELDPRYFELRIMGKGWNNVVEHIREIGFSVIYYQDFDREKYMELIPSLDYWLYYGFDEGAMGYLDAMAAGVKTIVTPQGYHLDTEVKPTYMCSTTSEFVRVMKNIQNERKAIVESVSEWTWKNFTQKHLEVWYYLLKAKPLNQIFENQGKYVDGIFSMLSIR